MENAVVRLSGTCSLVEVERAAIDAVKRRCIGFNQKRPEVGAGGSLGLRTRPGALIACALRGPARGA